MYEHTLFLSLLCRLIKNQHAQKGRKKARNSLARTLDAMNMSHVFCLKVIMV